jgi:exodeoxyribonuclease V alpha subunit
VDHLLRQRWLHELLELGYRDSHLYVPVAGLRGGELDRDRSVATVCAGSRRALRVEPGRHPRRGRTLIARSHVVADAAVRTDLAEDLTARTLAACVPLLPRPGLPEHIRALTSRHVLDVESDLGSL